MRIPIAYRPSSCWPLIRTSKNRSAKSIAFSAITDGTSGMPHSVIFRKTSRSNSSPSWVRR